MYINHYNIMKHKTTQTKKQHVLPTIIILLDVSEPRHTETHNSIGIAPREASKTSSCLPERSALTS